MLRSTMATMKDITTDRQQLTGSALILTFVDDTERHKRLDVIPMIPAVSRNLARPSLFVFSSPDSSEKVKDSALSSSILLFIILFFLILHWRCFKLLLVKPLVTGGQAPP